MIARSVHIVGQVLRDSTIQTKRNFVNLLLTIKLGDEEIHSYHLVNYAANAATVKHILKVVNSSDTEEMNKAYLAARDNPKLMLNRVVYMEIDEEFDLSDPSEFVNFLSGIELKVAIDKSKSFAAGMNSRLDAVLAERAAAASKKAVVEPRVWGDEHPLSVAESDDGENTADSISDDDLAALESASSFGKATSSTNKNWGMF